MRTALVLAAAGIACLLGCAQASATRLGQAGPVQEAGPVAVLHLDPGTGQLGKNLFRATVTNRGTVPVPFSLSLRVESPSHALQKSHYRLLQPGETAELEYEYERPNRGYRLLLSYYGIAQSMPTAQEPYPEFVNRRLRRFALQPAERNARERQRIAAEPAPLPPELAAARANACRQIAQVLDWERPAAPSFEARELGPEQLGGYRLQVVQIATEPDRTVELLFVRTAALAGRLPTILYLTGNPPGRKESGIVPGMFLADLGLQVVAVDRRESARHTGRGEYLTSVADPVFDAGRVVDYLLSRADVDPERIGVFGFSKGAEEGMFLAVLHPSVRAAALASRLVAQESLFASDGWLPTLYSEDVLSDLGLDSLVGNMSGLRSAITPEVSAKALRAYRTRYPWFDALDPAAVLPLAAPKPVLVVTGARDRQIALPGVLRLDDAVQAAYRDTGSPGNAELQIMPRSDHGMSAEAVENVGRWLDEWLGHAR